MRILALDVGTKTIGVAVCNSEETLALGVATLRRRSLEADCGEAAKLAASRGAELVVVGWPLTPRGAEGRAVERTRVFVEGLRKAVSVPVETWDERYTTAEAEARLREAGEPDAAPRPALRRVRRGVNAVAAALLLESFLDARRAGLSRAKRRERRA